MAVRSTASPVYKSTYADTKDYQIRDEPGRTYNGDWVKLIENQMPPQAFLKQDYYPNFTTESVEKDIEQKATAQLERDLQDLTRKLDKATKDKFEFIKRRDPEKVRFEKERSMKMKKSSLQQSFRCEEEEDTEAFNVLLEEAYSSNKQARKAIDQHMHLLESMQKSESIKSVEQHQRKSLGQIRELINQICTIRKKRPNEGF